MSDRSSIAQTPEPEKSAVCVGSILSRGQLNGNLGIGQKMSLVRAMPDCDPHSQSELGDASAQERRMEARSMASSLRVVLRQCMAVLGLFLIVLAMPIGLLTPLIPIGLPVAILGVVLLGRNAQWGKRWMEGILARYPKLERFAPNWMMRAVFGREKRSKI